MPSTVFPVNRVRRRLSRVDTSWAADRRTYQATMLAPFLRPGLSVLDIGCGSGLLAVELARWSGCSVTGLDVGDSRVAPIPLQIFDGRRIPMPSLSVDAVLLSFVLHHAADPAGLLAEALRVSREVVLVFEDAPGRRLGQELLAAHQRLYRWTYDLRSAPASARPGTAGNHLVALDAVTSRYPAQVVDLPPARFSRLYPVRRRLYAIRPSGSR